MLTNQASCKAPFHTFPTQMWLHKPEAADTGVAVPAGVPSSYHSSPQQKKAPRNGPDAIPIGGMGSRAWELCIPIALLSLMRHCRPAAVLHHPPSVSPGLLKWFPISPAPLSLCCHSTEELQAWHESVCLVSFLPH